MWSRFQVFRIRRKARYLSKVGNCELYAVYCDVRVGKYRAGKKVW